MRLYVSNLLSSMQFFRVASLKLSTMCLNVWSVTSLPTLWNFLAADLIFKISFSHGFRKGQYTGIVKITKFWAFQNFSTSFDLCMGALTVIIMRFKGWAITISLIKFMKDSAVNVLLIACNNSIHSELNTTIKLASKYEVGWNK